MNNAQATYGIGLSGDAQWHGRSIEFAANPDSRAYDASTLTYVQGNSTRFPLSGLAASDLVRVPQTTEDKVIEWLGFGMYVVFLAGIALGIIGSVVRIGGEPDKFLHWKFV